MEVEHWIPGRRPGPSSHLGSEWDRRARMNRCRILQVPAGTRPPSDLLQPPASPICRPPSTPASGPPSIVPLSMVATIGMSLQQPSEMPRTQAADTGKRTGLARPLLPTRPIAQVGTPTLVPSPERVVRHLGEHSLVEIRADAKSCRQGWELSPSELARFGRGARERQGFGGAAEADEKVRFGQKVDRVGSAVLLEGDASMTAMLGPGMQSLAPAPRDRRRAQGGGSLAAAMRACSRVADGFRQVIGGYSGTHSAEKLPGRTLAAQADDLLVPAGPGCQHGPRGERRFSATGNARAGKRLDG